LRRPLVVVAAIAAASTVTSLAPAQATSTHAIAKPVAKSAKPATAGQPIAFGAEVKPASGQSQQKAITSFEATTGHQLAFTRDYLLWNSPFPTSYEQWLAARGTVPFISVNPHTTSGAVITWASMAAAQPGDPVYARMKAWADEVKAFGYPVYFTFNHEPEAAASNKYGTAPQFIAAWQNFHNVFAAEGVTNATWIWIMTSFAFIVPTTDPRYAWNWYPGDAYVDAIGADAYTAYTCDNPGGVWHPLAYQIAGFVKFGTQHPTKPMWLPEWGVVEDGNTPGRKAQWITDAETLFKDAAYGQFAGIAYYNETRPGTVCNWQIATSTTAQAAYAAMAKDPFYSGTVNTTAPPPPDTTPPTVSITAPAAGSTQSGTVAVTASASDDVAVASVKFDVDGSLVSTSTTAPYTGVIDTTKLTNGTHTLTAVATDTSNNSTTSQPIGITVSNPVVTSNCPATPAGMTALSGNLSLETNQTGWTGVYNASSKNTRVSVSGGSYDGNWALQVAPKAGATGVAGVNNVSPYWVPGAPGLTTTAGRAYTGSAEVKASTPGEQVTVMLRETTTGGTGVSYASKTLTLADTGWHAVSTTYTAKSPGDQIRYSLYGTFTASTQSLLADCLSLTTAS
jgi:hypothetical protein